MKIWKKIIASVAILTLMSGNLAFAWENIDVVLYKKIFLYKNNVVKYFSNWEKTLNWKLFTWTIVVDEKEKIIHTLTQSWKVIKLNNIQLDVEFQNRVKFLENWWYLITELNPSKWKEFYISYNWKILFKWNKDLFKLKGANYIIGSKIINLSKNKLTTWIRSYFIDEKKQIIPIVWWWENFWVYFIDTQKNNLVYDITCKNNSLYFYHNWQELINTSWIHNLYWNKSIFFPTSILESGTFPIDTLLNINWKQYLLSNDGIGFQSCNIFFKSGGKSQTLEVKNSEIITNIQTQVLSWNEETEEYVEETNIEKIADWIYTGPNTVYYWWKVYILKNPKNNMDDFILNPELRELLIKLENSNSPRVESSITLNEYKKLIQSSKEVIVDNSGDKRKILEEYQKEMLKKTQEKQKILINKKIFYI